VGAGCEGVQADTITPPAVTAPKRKKSRRFIFLLISYSPRLVALYNDC
jgi:hypothetical protein